jgi:hypothetical protein
MKKAILVFTIFCGVSLVFGQPYKGPFGLKMGLTLDQLTKIDPDIIDYNGSMYIMKTVPIPYPSFEVYLAFIDSDTGLCSISGVTGDIDTNQYGTALQEEYQKIRDGVAQKYGEYMETDEVLPGSSWTEPEYFMMGLKLKERVLSSLWRRDFGSDLPDQIFGISLNSSASDLITGTLMLVYSFTNANESLQKVRDKENSAF